MICIFKRPPHELPHSLNASLRAVRGPPRAARWVSLALQACEHGSPELESEHDRSAERPSHFDEPWDGPSNRNPVGRVGRIYLRSGLESNQVHTTSFVAVVGPQTVWPGSTLTTYRLLLWELVYHDCVVAQWYWGDYNNKLPAVWDRRDL